MRKWSWSVYEKRFCKSKPPAQPMACSSPIRPWYRPAPQGALNLVLQPHPIPGQLLKQSPDYYFLHMPPVKPIWNSSKSCNKLPLELKSGGERERRSREYWESQLSEYWDSGLRVQEYCELKELPYENVRRWIRRLKKERTEDAKVEFMEVKTSSAPISSSTSGIRLKFGA